MHTSDASRGRSVRGVKKKDGRVDDRLVCLYTLIGDTRKAQEIHDDYVYRMQKYLQQKEDETLLEMEAIYNVKERRRSYELQIIRLSAEGLKASEIAERIYLSVHTVNTHRQRIYAKMDVRNVSDVLRKATDLGII